MPKSVSGWRLTAAELEGIVSAVGERIDAAALAPERWQDVLEGLQAALPGTGAILLATDTQLASPIVAASSGYSDGDMRTYGEYYSGINPWNVKWPASGLTPRFSEEALSSRDLHRTEFYNDWLKPIGEIDYSTGIKLFDSENRKALLALNYGAKHPGKKHEILAAILERLGPRLRGAVVANRNLALGRALRPNKPLVDALLEPAFLLDETCRLLSANAPAEDLISNAELIRIGRRDSFSLRDGANQHHLLQAVRKLCWRGTHEAGCEFTLSGGGKTWTAYLLPVAPNISSSATKGLSALFMPRALALLVLRAPDAEDFSSDDIILPRGLTPAEQRLARALLAGGSLAEIAVRLGVAYETVRSHLKAISAKTGSHSQRELIALLLRAQRK